MAHSSSSLGLTADQALQVALVNDLMSLTALCMGIFLGLLLTGVIKVILNFIGDRMQFPSRIKFSSTNGNTPDEYLYRWRGRYYTSDQYQFLLRNARQATSGFPQLPIQLLMFTFVFVCSALAIFVGYAAASFLGF